MTLSRSLFRSFFQGGFECSTHRRRDGQRLDIVAATRHDALAREDYALMRQLGLVTLRDGLRWHLIDKNGKYDWSSARPMMKAANEAGVQVIWDLFHYGWPDDLDIWSPEFVTRFADYAHAAARLLKEETQGPLLLTPVNEISFVAWAGGDMAIMNPLTTGRGHELKAILVRACISAITAIRAVDPEARIMQVEPLINPLPNPELPETVAVANGRNNGQYEAWDMMCGRLHPELGGKPEHLDIMGVNYYPHNQWIENWGPLHWTAGAYLPLRYLLFDCYRRYGRPMFIAETGIEAEHRPDWFRYVCGEVAVAMSFGVPVEGICLYPVMNHPGWEDGRHCPNGLIDYSTATFSRTVFDPLAQELACQQRTFTNDPPAAREGAIIPLDPGQ
jgi:beta-glucosidase/6-phospho-beta-glucosidase/beta-galactosidase